MGSHERAAYDACAAALEIAFASGELSVGARGWRTKRVEIVNRWLTGRPAADLEDGTGIGPGPRQRARERQLAEPDQRRTDRRVGARLPGQRSRLARGLIPRLLEPPAVPDDPLPTLHWLLGHAVEGLRLTARHYIAPALVTEAVEEFGWRDGARRHAPPGTRRVPLHTLRGMAQAEIGAIRRAATSLVLTKTGKLMTADPAARWHIGTAALIGPDDGLQPDFSAAVREAALMLVLTNGPTGYDELTRLLTDIHGVEGWAARGGSSSGPGRHGTGLHSTGLASAVRTELYALRHRLSGPSPARHRTQLGRGPAIADRYRGRGGAIRPARPGPAPAAPPRPRLIRLTGPRSGESTRCSSRPAWRRPPGTGDVPQLGRVAERGPELVRVRVHVQHRRHPPGEVGGPPDPVQAGVRVASAGSACRPRLGWPGRLARAVTSARARLRPLRPGGRHDVRRVTRPGTAAGSAWARRRSCASARWPSP